MVEIAALRADGALHVSQAKLPALPEFEQAFTAFARGTVLQTPRGDIAIEDLQPGDRVSTVAGGAAQVLWIGSGNLSPMQAGGRRTPLTRIMSDSFGEGRPESFLTLGPAARILQTPPRLRARAGGAAPVLTPIAEFVDDVNVISITPPTPVTLFHLVLDRHAAIYAGGLECETFHPGAQSLRNLTEPQRALFLSLFPHIAQPADFGPLAHPRAPEDGQDRAN